MDTIKQGILGGFSGKVGTVIGSFWKGKSYMRGLTQSFHDPKTASQLAQRAKFSVMSKFISQIQTVAKVGFKDSENGTTALNEALSYNLKNAITGTFPNFLIDYPNAVVSMGPLPNVENPTATDDGSGHVEFTWNNNTGDSGAEANDEVMIAVYNHDKNKALAITSVAKRADQTYTFTTPTAWSSDTAHVYIAVKSDKDTTTSKSEYLGSVVLS